MRITGWRRRVLRWLFRDLIRQGYGHFETTTEIYEMVREAWTDEFREDNTPAHDQDLTTCFNRTLRLGEVKYRFF